MACSVIGAIALLACCAMPAIACDDYTGDPSVPEAALRDLDYTQTGACDQGDGDYAVEQAPVIRLATTRGLLFPRRAPQRIVIQQQRPQRIVIQQQAPRAQRFVIQQAPRHAPPQRIIIQQQRPQRVIVRPPRQQAPLRIDVEQY